MQIYLFFKQYYIALGKNIALNLANRGVTPNIASIGSLFIIFPLFYLIYLSQLDTWWFVGVMIVALQIKLILNAIDGIIAREKDINTPLGMHLNVITDIGPDIFILSLIYLYFGADMSLVYTIITLSSLYLLSEIVFMILYKKQNLFYGKDLRTAFYYILLIGVPLGLSLKTGITLYFIILVIHHGGYCIKKYRA